MKNQSGRSMIEMLGVLAIIALLSVIGVAAYQYAVSRHEANSILKQSHEIASDVMFRQQMFSDRADGAELIFQGSDKTELMAFRVDSQVFRVETPALDEDVCLAILRLGRDYPMLLPQTFEEEENCTETEDGFVANLYFSILGNSRYAGNNGGSGDDPVVDPVIPDDCDKVCDSAPEATQCIPVTSQGSCCPEYTKTFKTGGECQTSDGRSGTCQNGTCIATKCPEGSCYAVDQNSSLSCVSDGTVIDDIACDPLNGGSCSYSKYECLQQSDGVYRCELKCGSVPTPPTSDCSTEGCEWGKCCVEGVCIDAGYNGSSCNGADDTTTCPTGYVCSPYGSSGDYLCLLECETSGGAVGGAVGGTGAGAGGGAGWCSPDNNYTKKIDYYDPISWEAKSNTDCEASDEYSGKCATCILAACFKDKLYTADGCGCPNDVYYGSVSDRKCCLDGEGNVGVVIDDNRTYCFPNQEKSGFWCKKTGTYPATCCPENAVYKWDTEDKMAISEGIYSGDGNLYYSLEACACPDGYYFDEEENNGYGKCVPSSCQYDYDCHPEGAIYYDSDTKTYKRKTSDSDSTSADTDYGPWEGTNQDNPSSGNYPNGCTNGYCELSTMYCDTNGESWLCKEYSLDNHMWNPTINRGQYSTCHCARDMTGAFWMQHWEIDNSECEVKDCPAGTYQTDEAYSDAYANCPRQDSCTSCPEERPYSVAGATLASDCFSCPENADAFTEYGGAGDRVSIPENKKLSGGNCYCAGEFVAVNNGENCCLPGQYWNGTKCVAASCPGEATLYDGSATPTRDTFDVFHPDDTVNPLFQCMCPEDYPVANGGVSLGDASPCQACSGVYVLGSGCVEVGVYCDNPGEYVTDETSCQKWGEVCDKENEYVYVNGSCYQKTSYCDQPGQYGTDKDSCQKWGEVCIEDGFGATYIGSTCVGTSDMCSNMSTYATDPDSCLVWSKACDQPMYWNVGECVDASSICETANSMTTDDECASLNDYGCNVVWFKMEGFDEGHCYASSESPCSEAHKWNFAQDEVSCPLWGRACGYSVSWEGECIVTGEASDDGSAV